MLLLSISELNPPSFYLRSAAFLIYQHKKPSGERNALYMLYYRGVPPVIRPGGPSRFLLFLVVLATTFVQVGSAQNITIRLINVKDGRPMKAQLLVLSLGDAKLASTPRVTVTTSPDGTAVVHLPEKIPEQVSVVVGNGKLHGCGWPFFASREVIEHGVVAENKCDPKGKLKGKFTAKPGEVIVFVRFLTWWERMQW